MAEPRGWGGSRRELERFVASASASLFRTGYLMTWDEAEAEDLLQETFLQVARRWNRIHRMERPLAYARRILVNLVIDDSRHRNRRRHELDAPSTPPVEPADDTTVRVLTGVDDSEALQWALAMLSPRQRAVLVLRYWSDLSETEIAETLDCAVGTVKSSTARAMERLRQLLGEGTDDGQPEDRGEATERRRPC